MVLVALFNIERDKHLIIESIHLSSETLAIQNKFSSLNLITNTSNHPKTFHYLKLKRGPKKLKYKNEDELISRSTLLYQITKNLLKRLKKIGKTHPWRPNSTVEKYQSIGFVRAKLERNISRFLGVPRRQDLEINQSDNFENSDRIFWGCTYKNLSGHTCSMVMFCDINRVLIIS